MRDRALQNPSAAARQVARSAELRERVGIGVMLISGHKMHFAYPLQAAKFRVLPGFAGRLNPAAVGRCQGRRCARSTARDAAQRFAALPGDLRLARPADCKGRQGYGLCLRLATSTSRWKGCEYWPPAGLGPLPPPCHSPPPGDTYAGRENTGFSSPLPCSWGSQGGGPNHGRANPSSGTGGGGLSPLLLKERG